MNIKIKQRLLTAACSLLACGAAIAQERVGISGKVVDATGNPLAGVSVAVEGTTLNSVTDENGVYNISVPGEVNVLFSFIGYQGQKVAVVANENVYNVTLIEKLESSEFQSQPIVVGAYKNFSRAESTAAVSVITNKDIDNRAAKSIANSILGQGKGLISLDGVGTYYDQQPTWYVRGLHSLTEQSSLVVVDGIEREIATLSPQEVESVSILKDAAAVALFGYKGVNDVVYITTKRGAYNMTSVKFAYDHLFTKHINRPEFLDGVEYMKARNEALVTNEGSAAQFSEYDIAATESQEGDYKYFFPNVDWVDETFEEWAKTDRYMLEFSGGGKKFKYFTMLNLLTDKGFVKNAEVNEGYDTQDVYVRGNLRNNLDIDLTDYTKLQINVAGVLSEMQQPGTQADLWDLVYAIPNNAFPIKNEKGFWGHSARNDGGSNPVAQATGTGYYKIHERALFADVVLDQSLSMFVKGLGFSARLGYDNFSTLYEDHSKTYLYGYSATSWTTDENGNAELVIGNYTEAGESGELGSGANTSTYERRAHLDAGMTFDRNFGADHYLYAQAKWDYEFQSTTGVNTTIHRHNFSWYSKYGFKNKYYLDLALIYSGSSRLVEGDKWGFSPTVSAAWVLSNENFLKGNSFVNFLKVRASYGMINADWLPEDSWTYDKQVYSSDGVIYPFDSTFQSTGNGRTTIGRMATENLTTEKSFKFNVGLDATLLNSLDVELDYYAVTNKDIWFDGSEVYTEVIGFDAPYVSEGEVNTGGFEVALDYNKKFGDVHFNIGGNLTKTWSEIVNMGEERRPVGSENLIQTGNPISRTYGLIAEGLFSQADIDAIDGTPEHPTHSFTTVRAGDIKYKDVNGDGTVNANDVCNIGDSYTCPELYYQFHLGAEWKGVGVKATFQGVGNYSKIANTTGYYWGLYDNTPIAKEVYEGRWKAEDNGASAKYPRLSSASNANNYQTSTFWMQDASYLQLRNAEIYYLFQPALLEKTKLIKGAKVYFSVIDPLDIEAIAYTSSSAHGTNSPLTTSFAIGASLQF